jgi:putative Holliday junction resolvase
MIVLGVDYGTKRIGLASGDSALAMAFPLRSIAAGDRAAGDVADIAAKEGAERIVVGVPRRMTGDPDAAPGETEEGALAFVEELRGATTLPVETEDERMTSAYADSVLAMSGGKKKDFDRDAVAAAAILETYLERMRRGAA